MVEKKPVKKATKPAAQGTTTKASDGFTAEERAAMRERTREIKAAARAGATRAEGERDLLAKIAEMPEPDRSMAIQS